MIAVIQELEYDLYKLMSEKHKDVLRPPEDWHTTDYPELFPILPDHLRDAVWKRQREYWVKKATGILPPPKRDKHACSAYFLKHVLRCKHTGYGLIGRTPQRNWRYYAISHFIENRDPSRPWLSKLVPADVIEEKVKTLVQETFRSTEILMPIIRSIVEEESSRAFDSHKRIKPLERQAEELEDQITFALNDLSDLGPDTVPKILQPLKERRHAVMGQLHELKNQSQAKLDVEATVTALVSEFGKLSIAMDEMAPQAMRNFLNSFLEIQIDMEKWAVDLHVKLPSWAVSSAKNLHDQLCSVVPASCHPDKAAHGKTARFIGSYTCQLGQEKHGRYFKPCATCSRQLIAA